MSGKLIMKRKRNEDIVSGPSGSSDNGTHPEVTSSQNKREKIEDDSSTTIKHNDGGTEPPKSTSATSKLLIEALQKIVELQSELDDFENDLDEHDNISEYADESRISLYSNEFSPPNRPMVSEEDLNETFERHEAEALGYAMCARESLLFLEREGIPVNSAIYRALRERLVGRAEGIPI